MAAQESLYHTGKSLGIGRIEFPKHNLCARLAQRNSRLRLEPCLSLLDKYQLAFEVSPVPMLLVDGDGKIVLANAPLCTLFEYAHDDLIGAGVERLVPKSIRDHHPDLRKAYAKAPVKRDMGTGRDLFGVTKSGALIPLELGLEPVEAGDSVWALVVAIDIRQRKRLEERMQLALDASASAMVMVDESGKIAFVNKSALTLFGYSEDQLLHQAVEMLVPDASARAHPVYLKSFMNDKTARRMGLGRDLFARHQDGRLIPVEITLTPVETDDETFVMSTIVDLTERVAAKRSLERRNEELISLNSEISQFAYSASHDLKAPLVSISGLLQIVIEDLEEGKTDGVLKDLRDANDISTQSAKKVEAVLQLARVGRDRIPAEPVHLRNMLNETWLGVAGHSDSIRLELDLAHTDPIFVERASFGVIVENILSNAYRFRDDAKSECVVTVRAEDEGAGLRLVVSDNGVGIPEESQALVFDTFKRLGAQSGSGLGLALVKKQVDRLGGEISLSSVEGEGTEFSLLIPRGEQS